MSVNKFKVDDVVKCVDDSSLVNLTTGKEYVVVKTYDNDMVMIDNDNGDSFYYYSFRFELSNDSANTSQPSKFKEGDMVYLIGLGCLKPRKLRTGFNNGLPMKFKVEVGNDVFKTFTEDGKYLTIDLTPSIVLATEEHRQMLNKLLGVEYEPLKLVGSDLAKKLLKDKPQTCWVSDVSDDYATLSGGVVLIMEFENDRFISKMGAGWKFAVPCDKHGEVLEYE